MGGALCIVMGVLLLTCLLGFCGQALPYLEWQRCLGGSGDDYAYDIRQTSDGGFVLAGKTESNNGNVNGNHGGGDCWVTKLNAKGKIGWQRCLGGSRGDQASSIQQTADGGYILAGGTRSNNGNVSGNHGGYDAWMALLDSGGSLVWQRCLGGSENDYAHSVRQTKDGGFVLTGYTASNNGDVEYNHGSADCWVVKLDASGALDWQMCLGGSSDDIALSVQQTTDGGYVLAGWTRSNNGNVSGNHGSADCWIAKLNEDGRISWQRCLGGSLWDVATSIQQTVYGGYIVAGYTDSDDGDVSGNHGSNDGWAVLLDPSGNLVWQRCLGGGRGDAAMSIQPTPDGGYILAGSTQSSDGDVSGNRGGDDCWIAKLNPSGDLVWQRCLGGSGLDIAYGVQPITDGGYILAGFTQSNNGDVKANHGSFDFWVAKQKEIDCCISAPDLVCSGSWGNVATTAETGASYAWSIINGTITSSIDAQSINFTAGASRTARLAVNVTKRGSWKECCKEIAISPECNRTSDLSAGDSSVQRRSRWKSEERDFVDGLCNVQEGKVRIYPG
jgi:hypothetical protein